MEALNVSAARQALSDFLPILTVEPRYSFRELLIFFWGPVALICTILVLSRPCLVDIGVLSLTTADLSLSFSIELF